MNTVRYTYGTVACYKLGYPMNPLILCPKVRRILRSTFGFRSTKFELALEEDPKACCDDDANEETFVDMTTLNTSTCSTGIASLI
jgi:hypothetical protein